MRLTVHERYTDFALMSLRLMSVLAFALQQTMSALPPKADICIALTHAKWIAIRSPRSPG
jgi:hypothetical protein